MLRFAVLAVAAFALSAPASAEQATRKDNKSDVDRIVCKKEDTIGSRLAAKKVCLSVAEWRRLAELNREETERAQHNARAPEGN